MNKYGLMMNGRQVAVFDDRDIAPDVASLIKDDNDLAILRGYYPALQTSGIEVVTLGEPRKESLHDIYIVTVLNDGTVSLVTRDVVVGPLASRPSWVVLGDKNGVIAASVVSAREAVLKATEYLKRTIDDNAAKGGSCITTN